VSKDCHTFDHPADVGLAARADSLAELFEALAEGLADLVCPRETVRPAEARAIEVRAEPPAAPEVEDILHDFLSAVLAEIQERRFLVSSVSVTRASETEAEGELRGETYDPDRHDIRVEVKAVTYHQLKVAREGREWTGTVILDL
jgi:SHS2 domain-containing protein